MTKENVINFVAANIKNYLPAEYQEAEITVLSVTKLNNTYTGLSVRMPNVSIVPTLNLDASLVDITDEKQLEMKMTEIAKEFLENKAPNVEMDTITDYSKAKSRLFVKVSNAETNADALNTIPHIKIADLAITYHVMLEYNEEHVVAATIQNAMLSLWGIEKETLFADAMVSSLTLMPTKICSLAETLGLMGVLVGGENPLVIVTNESGMHGAAALFYPGVFEKIAERVGGSYYVLPSSIHEVLVLPEKENQAPVSSLKEMVTEINVAEVRPDEKLSDSVYFYNAETHEFSKVA